MLEPATTVAFVPTKDLERARHFYVDVLGLTLIEANDYVCVVGPPSSPTRITLVDAFVPQPFTVLGWVVPDLDETLTELRARGVEFLRYPGMDQDDAGTWTSPTGARVAWFHDPDANTLSITALPELARRRPTG